MHKLTAWLKKIDENLLKIFISIFIFLIPLYPKFPLIYLEYTVVKIRFDDIFVLGIVAVYFIQLLRRKEQLQKKFIVPILIFWSAVFLSYLFGAFVTHTVEFVQIGFLHSLRRVEYMMIFFIAASSLKSLKDLYYYMRLAVITITLVCLYGLGQKFLGFPAVQTMNPEFARGHLLYLTPEARVSSTFAGHYDLAAYLIFMMPIILGYFFRKHNYFYFFTFVLSLLILVMTASRISFIAYVISTIAYLIFLKKPKWLFIVVVLTVAFNLFSNDLVKRFLSTFQFRQIFVGIGTNNQVINPQKITTKELPGGTFYVPVKDGTVDEATVKKNEALLHQKLLEDLNNQASKGATLSADEANRRVASMAAQLQATNTVVLDISASTRFQVEWPRAIKAFLRNPILGTGPSSITEATDNDILRWLGETGLAGTLAFLYILFLPVQMIWMKRKDILPEDTAVYFGYIFGAGALLINASYIDVFEASKVAYQFWMMTGFIVAAITLEHTRHISQK